MKQNYFQKDESYLRERVGCMEQLADLRCCVLDDGSGRGSRIIEVNNGSGLRFTINAERALDLADASCDGIPLAWRSCNGLAAPQFSESDGIGWLRNWSGGLLTTCGLRNVGGPCEVDGETFGLHGRASNIPAQEVCCHKGWVNGKYTLTVSGTIRQTRVFGEKLELRRKIVTCMGENSIVIEDTVENQGFAVSPLMLLYHINLGYPLLGENTVLTADEHQVSPKDETAAAGLAEWMRCAVPQADFAEQVFYHELPADPNGMASITATNPDIGLALRLEYRRRELPCLVQWKQMGQGEYVLGLEPANCFPEGQAAMREKHMLREIAPGEHVNTRIKIAVLVGVGRA